MSETDSYTREQYDSKTANRVVGDKAERQNIQVLARTLDPFYRVVIVRRGTTMTKMTSDIGQICEKFIDHHDARQIKEQYRVQRFTEVKLEPIVEDKSKLRKYGLCLDVNTPRCRI